MWFDHLNEKARLKLLKSKSSKSRQRLKEECVCFDVHKEIYNQLDDGDVSSYNTPFARAFTRWKALAEREFLKNQVGPGNAPAFSAKT